MMKNTFREISEARKVLGLPEKATLTEIKSAYQSLVKQWHPDKNPGESEKCVEMTQEINRAYEVIMAYCDRYQISFQKEDVAQYRSAEEEWMDQFGHDPLWS